MRHFLHLQSVALSRMSLVPVLGVTGRNFSTKEGGGGAQQVREGQRPPKTWTPPRVCSVPLRI